MKINVENVTEKFKLYSGEPFDGAEPTRDELCGELCGECADMVLQRVRPEVLQDEEFEGAGALECLAAAEAFLQLATLDNAVTPQTVTSPEIKIQLGDRVGSAERLRDEKRAACRGLLAEDGFYFGAT